MGYSDAIREIVFSLGGVDAASYREVMGLDFDTVYNNVKYFCLMNKGKIPTSATCPLHSRTRPFINKWGLLWTPLVGQRASFTSLFNFAGKIHDELEHRANAAHEPKYCCRLNQMAVLWDGRVALCCMDSEG